MKDQLAYRIPGKSAKIEMGSWKKVDLSSVNSDSFIITDFRKENAFQFFVEANGWNNSFYLKPALYKAQSKQDYLAQLTAFIDGFIDVKVQKAIYSRIDKVKVRNINIQSLFKRLCETYPKAFVYLVSSEKFGTWMGATPEVLFEGKGKSYKTMSLAGTKKNEKSVWGEKEIEEQALVTDYILAKLNKRGVKKLCSDGPKTMSTGSVFHLKTDISFELEDNKWFDVVEELHPTPAVCGVPTEKAFNHILTFEQHRRDFYCGVIGSITNKESHLFVNLRCMQIHPEEVSLYVGGGITSKSIPEDEYQETVNKAATLKKVLK